MPKTQTRNGQLKDYLVAFLILAGAVVARLLLDYVVPERFPFITFFQQFFLPRIIAA
jgi:hypothetical protein